MYTELCLNDKVSFSCFNNAMHGLEKIEDLEIFDNSNNNLLVMVDYTKPSTEERLFIVVDPMLATGGSAIAAINSLKQRGVTDIKFMCLIAAPEGVEALHTAHPDVEIFIAGLDEKLNDHGYIVPGLGDAGDRIFGTK